MMNTAKWQIHLTSFPQILLALLRAISIHRKKMGTSQWEEGTKDMEIEKKIVNL